LSPACPRPTRPGVLGAPEYDAADSVRFYALRLHEAGMITSTPQEIIAEGTDWRFLNELKQELKA
jgi:NitT/TauT family transport system substrate-binding protein